MFFFVQLIKNIYLCGGFSLTFSKMGTETSEQLLPLWQLNNIWSTLTEPEREYISQHVDIVRYDKNEIIHLDGEESNYVWVLISGKVRIYKEGIGQRAQIIRLLKPYDIFGYRAAIATESYNSNASACEPCVVYRMSNRVFSDLIRSNGIFCYQIMRTMAKDLAFSEIQTVNLTQKHIRGRLAESLLNLRKKYGYEEDGETLAMALSREDLASMSNMTTSNAIRTLSQFAQEDIICINKKHILITNEKELERISRLG